MKTYMVRINERVRGLLDREKELLLASIESGAVLCPACTRRPCECGDNNNRHWRGISDAALLTHVLERREKARQAHKVRAGRSRKRRAKKGGA